jgi:hypothetical protein
MGICFGRVSIDITLARRQAQKAFFSTQTTLRFERCMIYHDDDLLQRYIIVIEWNKKLEVSAPVPLPLL